MVSRLVAIFSVIRIPFKLRILKNSVANGVRFPFFKCFSRRYARRPGRFAGLKNLRPSAFLLRIMLTITEASTLHPAFCFHLPHVSHFRLNRKVTLERSFAEANFAFTLHVHSATALDGKSETSALIMFVAINTAAAHIDRQIVRILGICLGKTLGSEIGRAS